MIVHPRSFTLSRNEPEQGAANVFRCEILQTMPLSATLSTQNGRMKGLMRISLLLGADVPSTPPPR